MSVDRKVRQVRVGCRALKDRADCKVLWGLEGRQAITVLKAIRDLQDHPEWMAFPELLACKEIRVRRAQQDLRDRLGRPGQLVRKGRWATPEQLAFGEWMARLVPRDRQDRAEKWVCRGLLAQWAQLAQLDQTGQQQGQPHQTPLSLRVTSTLDKIGWCRTTRYDTRLQQLTQRRRDDGEGSSHCNDGCWCADADTSCCPTIGPFGQLWCVNSADDAVLR